MKNKLRKLMALFVASAFVGNVGAQTDVTSTYLKNPSFELSEEGINLTAVQKASDASTLSMYGWTQNLNGITNFNNTELVDNTTKASNSNHSDPVVAKEGSYHLFFRRSWNNGSTKDVSFTSNSARYPKGDYSVTFSYILEEGTSKGNTSKGSYLTIKALSGETEKGTIKLEAHNHGNENYIYNKDWTESTLTFALSEETELAIAAILTPRGGNKTELHLDNFVIKYSNTGVNELKALIAKANGLNSKLSTLSEDIIAQAEQVYDGINHTPEYQNVIDEAIATLQSEIDEKWAAYELNPEGDDVTCLFINTGFDEEINFSSESIGNTAAATVYPTLGWTSTVGGNSTGATIGYGYTGTINGGNATAPATNSDDTTEGGALFICVGWSGTVIYKSLPATLAAGLYTITYKAYNGNTMITNALDIIPLIGFVPEEGEAIISNTTETFANQQWVEKTYSFTLSEETKGQIQIGMKPTTNTYSYNAPELFIDKITLTYYNPSIKALMDAVEKAKNATAVNVGVNAFQHPQAAADILNSTREEAEDILANVSDIATIENATVALNEAIDVFEAVELNAPQAPLVLKLTQEGFKYNGNAVTFSNDKTGEGNHSLTYLYAENANYGQAIIFTPVEEEGETNVYTMSFIAADGDIRYICTGVPYGGSTQQIRVTTSADDALKVRVDATATEGIVKFYNTAHNAYIGSNGDHGVYTDNKYTNFTVSEAKMATASLKITDAGWATIILPFECPIPDGVTAYTCEDAVDGVLNLTKVEDGVFSANIPYLIEGAETELELTGYGTAFKDNYTEGLLVGTYVDYETTANSNTYVLQNKNEAVAFYLVGESVQPWIRANRCYMSYETAAGAPMFSFGRGNDETTGIEPSTLNPQPSTIVYDLQGRRVEKMEKGIYIVNGRKVVIR